MTKKTKKAARKSRNPQDTTLRNLRATKKRLDKMQAEINWLYLHLHLSKKYD